MSELEVTNIQHSSDLEDLPLLIEDDEDDRARVIFYGDAGIGKTTLLGSCADDERTWPAIMLSLEAGTKAIRSKRRKVSLYKADEKDNKGQLLNPKGLPLAGTDPQKGKIDVIHLHTWAEIQKMYDHLYRWAYIEKQPVYKSTSLDTLTEINYMSLAKIVLEPIPGKPRLDAKVPEQRDYLKNNILMKDMMRALRDLKSTHVFISCHPTDKEERASGIVKTMLNLTGRLSGEAEAIYDYVGLMRMNPAGKREIIFQPQVGFRAKERSEWGSHIIRLTEKDRPITISDFLDAAKL